MVTAEGNDLNFAPADSSGSNEHLLCCEENACLLANDINLFEHVDIKKK